MVDQLYGDIIINISHENLDKTYQYAVPNELQEDIEIGTLVEVPFGRGNRVIKGYVVGLSARPKIDINLIKPIKNIVEDGIVIESHLIYLAHWIKESFGSTMNDALKTVIPVKKAVKAKEERSIRLKISKDEAIEFHNECKRKSHKARERLIKALLENPVIEYDFVIKKLKISRTTLSDLEKLGTIELLSKAVARNPIFEKSKEEPKKTLNAEQEHIAKSIIEDYDNARRGTYLIHGVTGSGKTEVYMEIMEHVIKQNKEVIYLIPEIALTYQMVLRLYSRFGERVSILNSTMSHGEKHDQSMRAKNGEIDIIIGPRSALFTPFQNIGLIVIDEEHESSYKSEYPPKYHAVDVAIKRASLLGASVVLGSATPSIESYKKALDGEYRLFKIENRAMNAQLPDVSIVDLREELRQRNLSIFSRKLRALIEDRLKKKEQIILFLNRRGYSGFVSCRSCGHVMKCNHCDISLTYHNSKQLVCHYCNYREGMPSHCPMCKSKYIATFGTGTQKIEELIRKEFPQARVLRMDRDTTKGKDSHAKILKAFSEHKADILIGTQMIVKGHDYPKITLVGILAADLSLHVGDFRASEKTFQLLSQAAGRAGRADLPGETIIQTYNPDHYSITLAAKGDYEEFYKQEIAYRKLMFYPPEAHILLALVGAKDEEKAKEASGLIGKVIAEHIKGKEDEMRVIGPAPAELTKAHDIYRYVIYIKHKEYNALVDIKNYIEGYFNYSARFQEVMLQFDFNPIDSY